MMLNIDSRWFVAAESLGTFFLFIFFSHNSNHKTVRYGSKKSIHVLFTHVARLCLSSYYVIITLLKFYILFIIFFNAFRCIFYLGFYNSLFLLLHLSSLTFSIVSWLILSLSSSHFHVHSFLFSVLVYAGSLNVYWCIIFFIIYKQNSIPSCYSTTILHLLLNDIKSMHALHWTESVSLFFFFTFVFNIV